MRFSNTCLTSVGHRDMPNARGIHSLEPKSTEIHSTGYNPIQGMSHTKYEHLYQLSKINSTLGLYLLKVIPNSI